MLHRSVKEITEPNALWLGLLAMLMIAMLVSPRAHGQSRESLAFRHRSIDQWRTNRIIVKWRASGVAAVQMPGVTERTARLARTTGLALQPAGHLFGTTDVILLDHTPSHEEMQRTIGSLIADPAVE